MRIAVLGGGNIGTLMAAELAAKGHEVIVYSSKPQAWSHEITVLNPDDSIVLQSRLAAITDSLESAVAHSDLIFITTPAQSFKALAAKLLPYVSAGQMLGVVPGSGGAEFAFRPLLEKKCILFGLQRVHSIARLQEYGKSVYMLGRKDGLQIGAIPADKTHALCALLEGMFDMPCSALANYLAVTLTPSNPILHTTRLYSMFHGYANDTRYPKNILFYEEWSDEASEILIQCDNELQQLCEKIPLDLHEVKSLREHYESPDVAAMTKKISGIPAFRGLLSPMKEQPGGWIPDFSSRYFTADFSYGLKIILEIAHLFHVPTPNIVTVWDWYQHVSPEDAKAAFSLTLTREDFLQLYIQ